MAPANFRTLSATPETKTPDEINQNDGQNRQKADFDEDPKVLFGLLQIIQHSTPS
jgi:hypothetical protein